MSHRERIELMVWRTLCLTLLVATLGIVGLMFAGVNVAKDVSIAVGVQWGALLAAIKWGR